MKPNCQDCKHLYRGAPGFMPMCQAPMLEKVMYIQRTYAANVRDTGALCGPVGRWYEKTQE